MPPMSKWKISAELAEIVPEIKETLPITKYYLDVTPGAIARLQSKCTDAMNGKISVPGKSFVDEARINEEVFGEIILWKLMDDSVSEDQRRTFYRSFIDAWQGTEVQGAIGRWGDQQGLPFGTARG
jgi:hypothetical protein